MKNFFKVFFLYFSLGLVVYFNSFNNKFLMDDRGFFKNPVYSNAKFAFSQWDPYREQSLGVLDNHASLGYYRPMAHMVLDFCYSTFKEKYWQYHLLNLFLFVCVSSLIYLLVIKIAGNFNLALLSGLFYLVHPINGVVVDYISACVFSFQMIFMLSTILLLMASLEKKNGRSLYFLSLASCFLSLFWHESGVMLPFYVLAFILMFRNDPVKSKILYLSPYFLIILSYILLRSCMDLRIDALGRTSSFHFTWGQYGASLFQVLSWYLSKLFCPQGIVMEWAVAVPHQHSIINVIGLCSLMVSFILFFIWFAKERICQLALVLILIGFAPVCLASFRRPDIGPLIEPHWFIFSSIGFFILFAYFILMILECVKSIGLVLLFTAIFFWASISYANNQLWADQRTYAQYWAQQVPDLRLADVYLADAYQNEGNLKESEKYYTLALSGYSSDADIYNNLGLDLQLEGDLKGAEAYYRKALRISPNAANSYNNLGSVYFAEGRLELAKRSFEQSLIFNPLLLEPRRSLALILVQRAQYSQAITLCFKNLEIQDNEPKTLLLLSYIYLKENDIVRAESCVKRILTVESDPVVLAGLGVVLYRDKLPGLATKCFDKAIGIWKRGLSMDPSNINFKKDIANVEELKLGKSG